MKYFHIAAIGMFPVISHAAQLEVTATNRLPPARTSQTIEILAADLAPLEAKTLNLVHVRDSTGQDLVCQALDTNRDELRDFDAVIFQSDFAAGETKTFTLSVGAKQVYPKEQYKAFGRFVRERFDDFTWENDRIAHRTYGAALETWKGEPLSSSTIEIWSKCTPRMVMSDWHLADDYHIDHGEGADFYSAGLSRSCGGSGLWADDRLRVSRNFISSHVLAKADATDAATYWAGFCRDKAGLYQDAVAWKAHVAEFAQGLGSPLEIKTALSKDP